MNYHPAESNKLYTVLYYKCLAGQIDISYLENSANPGQMASSEAI